MSPKRRSAAVASGSAAVVNTDPEREDSESTSCTGMGYVSEPGKVSSPGGAPRAAGGKSCGLRSRVGAGASTTAASGPWPGPPAREKPHHAGSLL